VQIQDVTPEDYSAHFIKYFFKDPADHAAAVNQFIFRKKAFHIIETHSPLG